jgi:hypothetical protein
LEDHEIKSRFGPTRPAGEEFRRMKKLSALVAAIVVSLSAVGAALAITNGKRDGNARPGAASCWSRSVNTRTDMQAAADFLRPYLALRWRGPMRAGA